MTKGSLIRLIVPDRYSEHDMKSVQVFEAYTGSDVFAEIGKVCIFLGEVEFDSPRYGWSSVMFNDRIYNVPSDFIGEFNGKV